MLRQASVPTTTGRACCVPRGGRWPLVVNGELDPETVTSLFAAAADRVAARAPAPSSGSVAAAREVRVRAPGAPVQRTLELLEVKHSILGNA